MKLSTHRHIFWLLFLDPFCLAESLNHKKQKRYPISCQNFKTLCHYEQSCSRSHIALVLKPQKAINDFPPKLYLWLLMMHNTDFKIFCVQNCCCFWKTWTALGFHLKIISFLNFPKGDNILDCWDWKVIYDIWIESSRFFSKGSKPLTKNSANCC